MARKYTPHVTEDVEEEVTETEEQPVAQKTEQVQTLYEASEIARNAPRLFGYSIDIATAALAMKKVKSCTLKRAEEIIRDFAERKV